MANLIAASALARHGDPVCVAPGLPDRLPQDGFLATEHWHKPNLRKPNLRKLVPDDRFAARFGAHALISHDPAMTAVLQRSQQIAWSEASVLIQGESGTGKEVLARHIHRHSRRVNGPFVALNCAAIPEHLLESELFGHEKGAFSGAIGRRIGKFEAAAGGTILLDEISEMDSRLQAKLLRALQEREVDRVGGKFPIRLDVRVIATTNKDLWAEVAGKAFRQDLFFRLNVAPLHIPPLRERPADIDALSDYFARKYADQNGLPAAPFAAPARALLRAYAWPGNVRELENIIHRAVVMTAGGVITPDVLDLRRRGGVPRLLPSDEHDNASGGFVARSLTQMEQDLILHTLAFTRGNRTHAATILGISIRALRNKLHDYAARGIDVPAPMMPGAG
ncbi:sigma-54 interaction domain-containing protein [Rhodopila sp.]|uniref:sigma-54 interaction domain-containing protein n=1 Tax=Rhodopila sp. TaxID=2480087 RepID=UPI003D127EA0